ncbi:MAG TPA: DUF1854 domain-containing protein [Gemmatimonadaceae bacterium]|jgi:hypothetical protein|nr:DUF1854 domain-containing protein [Gemmatimonadaceae bacterium]
MTNVSPIEHPVPEPRHPLCLRMGDGGGLVVVEDGVATPVRLQQCFPWSAPHEHLSLRDATDRELALVEHPSLLDALSRRALEQALAVAGFVLDVARVVSVEEEIEIRQWTVETTSGTRSFQTHLDDWPRVLPDGGLLIRDVGGDLYRFSSPQAMDKRSRELLWAFAD